MNKIMNSEDLTYECIYKFPTSQLQLDGKKSSYYEVINSLLFKECNEAVVRICQKYSQKEIDNLINSTPFLTDIHKEFYKYIIRQRYEKILLFAYKKLTGKI